jgi:hypothetical protein
MDPKDADGMTDRDATALRTAEAIRSLATTPAAKSPKSPASPNKPAAPVAPATLEPPPIPDGPDAPAVPEVSRWPGEDALPTPGEILEVPVLRVGAFAGAGFITPMPTVAAGLSLRGQISPKFNIAALIMGTKNIDEGDEELDHDIYSARASLLASWEILGANHSWTPSIGGGLFGEFRYWNYSGWTALDEGPRGDEITLGSSYYTPVHEGALVGVGFAATAGISIAHPWRFRFDVHADMRMIDVAVDGSGQEEMAPELGSSVLGTFGIEYDFITKPVLMNTARR